MTDDELKALVASLAVSQDRTHELIKALGAKVDQMAIAQDRTDHYLPCSARFARWGVTFELRARSGAFR